MVLRGPQLLGSHRRWVITPLMLRNIILREGLPRIPSEVYKNQVFQHSSGFMLMCALNKDRNCYRPSRDPRTLTSLIFQIHTMGCSSSRHYDPSSERPRESQRSNVHGSSSGGGRSGRSSRRQHDVYQQASRRRSADTELGNMGGSSYQGSSVDATYHHRPGAMTSAEVGWTAGSSANFTPQGSHAG